MINDFKKDNYFSSIFEEPPLVRNISYEMNKGEHIFLDNKGSNYICNIYGDQKPKFQYPLSGFISGKERKILKNSKSLSDILISNRFKLAKNSDNRNYLPSLNKFEGYAPFPRPMCPPFGNLPSYIMKRNTKLKLKNKLEQSFDKEENKDLFKKEEENKGLSYITSNIKGVINNNENNDIINNNSLRSYNKDKTFLIKLINSTCNECKNQNINSLGEIKNNSQTVRALNHLRKKLLNNEETSMINGRKLKEPNKFMVNEYRIINKKLFHDFKSTNNILSQHRNLVKSFSQFDLHVNQILNKDKSDEKKIMTSRKILDKISINSFTKRPKNLKKRILFPNDITSSIVKHSLNKSEENLKHNLLNISRNKDHLDFNRKSSFNSNDRKKNIIRYMLDDQETKESIASRPNNNNLFLIRSISNENNKAENISFISEHYNIFKFRKNIHYMKNLEKKSLNERRLLEGYKIEEPKKPKIFGPKEDDMPKYRDFGEIYKKELETLEKCNPILFELEKKNNEKELEKLKRKKEFKKIAEKLKTKGKGLKIKKSGN